MNIVITVSRQLGSRGSYIATAVAKTMGLRYIDREILNRAAEIAGYPDQDMVDQLQRQETIPSFLDRIVEALDTMPMIPTIASATMREGYAYDDQLSMLMIREGLSREEALHKLVEHERRVEAGEAYGELIQQVIKEYAQIGNVIIAGRGGQVVLGDFPNVLHVRVQAPKKLRILHLMERLGLEEKDAERQIQQNDKGRARYMKHYYNVNWENPDLYHLVINTGKLSVDITTRAICTMAREIAQEVPE